MRKVSRFNVKNVSWVCVYTAFCVSAVDQWEMILPLWSDWLFVLYRPQLFRTLLSVYILKTIPSVELNNSRISVLSPPWSKTLSNHIKWLIIWLILFFCFDLFPCLLHYNKNYLSLYQIFLNIFVLTRQINIAI